MRTAITPLLLLGALSLCGATLAAEPAVANTEVVHSGVKAAIDPKTGKLRPLSAAESRKLDLGMTRQAAGKRGPQRLTLKQALATKRTLSNGTVAIKLPAELMSELTVRRHADGSLSIRHADDGHGDVE